GCRRPQAPWSADPSQLSSEARLWGLVGGVLAAGWAVGGGRWPVGGAPGRPRKAGGQARVSLLLSGTVASVAEVASQRPRPGHKGRGHSVSPYRLEGRWPGLGARAPLLGVRDLKPERISHVLLCNVTQRVSFWFVVTDPSEKHTLPAVEVQEAIRMNRNRINNAFFLNDQTLEFLKIPSTLIPPTDPPVPIWIIIFGVIFCIVIVAIILLILSGIRQRRRKDKGPSEVDDTEDKCENTITIENGIPCDPLDTKGGHVNDAFMTEDERLTPL
uniref:Collectrin, amino acid transport regulator n=1 Tax=Equus caballus TaxID=9796 RepID=A0A5F5PUR2_HORSE